VGEAVVTDGNRGIRCGAIYPNGQSESFRGYSAGHFRENDRAAHVSGILTRACQDCHSNQTVWPWYSQIAPVSWLIVHDVNEGRGELNFSEWGRYTARRQDRKLKEICEQVERGKMPMPIYTFMHPQTKLTASDRKATCEWTAAARKNLAAAAMASDR
jgi:Haem-binding domain